MKIVKRTKAFLIVQKRNGRHGVKTIHGKWINGEEKIKILVKEGILTPQEAKKEAAPAAEETPAEEAPAAE